MNVLNFDFINNLNVFTILKQFKVNMEAYDCFCFGVILLIHLLYFKKLEDLEKQCF